MHTSTSRNIAAITVALAALALSAVAPTSASAVTTGLRTLPRTSAQTSPRTVDGTGAAGVPTYRMTTVGPVTGSGSVAVAINSKGVLLGQDKFGFFVSPVTPSTWYRLASSRAGRAYSMGSPASINATGNVVANVYSSGGPAIAQWNTRGQMSIIPQGPTSWGVLRVAAINNKGQIVASGARSAFVRSGSSWRAISNGSYTHCAATDINDVGVVVGTCARITPGRATTNVPVITIANTFRPLKTPVAKSPFLAGTAASAISDRGYYIAGAGDQPLLWYRAGAYTQLSAGGPSLLDINDSGRALLNVPAGGRLLLGGAGYMLTTITTNRPAGWLIPEAAAINASGAIAATARRNTGVSAAVILTPTS